MGRWEKWEQGSSLAGKSGSSGAHWNLSPLLRNSLSQMHMNKEIQTQPQGLPGVKYHCSPLPPDCLWFPPPFCWMQHLPFWCSYISGGWDWALIPFTTKASLWHCSTPSYLDRGFFSAPMTWRAFWLLCVFSTTSVVSNLGVATPWGVASWFSGDHRTPSLNANIDAFQHHFKSYILATFSGNFHGFTALSWVLNIPMEIMQNSPQKI